MLIRMRKNGVLDNAMLRGYIYRLRTALQCKGYTVFIFPISTLCRTNPKTHALFHLGCRLLQKGYTLTEIVQVVMEVEEVKKSRAESVKLNGREKLMFAVDSAGRTIRKIVGNTGKHERGPISVQARMA